MLCLCYAILVNGCATKAPGAADGPCYPNNTCNQDLSCIAGRCAPTPDVGLLNSPCYASNATCGADFDGGLACFNGHCELTACRSGTAGCPCSRDGRCPGPSLSCLLNRCVRSGCSAGEVGCVCGAGVGCTSGSACIWNVCRAPDGVEVVIATGIRVRGCDVALGLPQGARGTADFSGSVRGQYLQRGGVLALSFIERPSDELIIEPPRGPTDRPPGLFGAVARISTGGMGLPFLQRFNCYDALGNPIPAANVVLQ